MAYFERVDRTRFRATRHVSGAWDPVDQHIAPALGLLVHAVELDRGSRGSDHLGVGRLSFDILGTVPVGIVDVAVRVRRPGRTIELVEATMSHAGRDVVLLRAWLMQAADTRPVAATSFPPLAPPDEMEPWDPTDVWPGGFIASAQVRRRQSEPGRASFWVRSSTPLVRDEPVSDLARMAGLLDIANGMTVRADPGEVAFPNVDLTAHLFTAPRGDWLGFDTTVSFGPAGLGLTSSVLHDQDGPVGTLAQSLTVRPR
ncbi:thioesterase family protein [Nocardioides mesophilus]|uniref:Thioesterase family protein n=1 Tax=Nocardioides mesophilus TaxID=433659 RepID=A0A7G9RA07_9ACTN|nr:thioesterase family protein [Nocardioides mesophilus]QNN52432.1 thioesterase family protein [Nocardioides mesophilus]